MGVTVENFVKFYKANSKAKDKTFEDFMKKHITTEYVGFIEKCVWCDSIVKASCYVKDGDYEYVKVNSANRYIAFVMRLISLYTDIEIDFENAKFVEQYDELNKAGAINALIAAIPEDEYSEFSTILNMKMDDFRDNEYSITALLYNLKKSSSLFEEVINQVLESDEFKAIVENLGNKE